MTSAVAPAGLPQSLRGLDRCLVMGVLNVTADSFSDGGRYLDADAAVAHGLAMMRAGADMIDVGGESTRPGARRVAAEQEQARVIPVVDALTARGVPVSIDTMRAQTAAHAVAAGACLVNDVSGGLADPDMLAVVAGLRVPYVAMHWRAHSDRMAAAAVYGDVVSEVVAELGARRAAALAAGIRLDRIVVDPGLGFAKEAYHNWALLRALPQLQELGAPVLIGASRKRFLGGLLADAQCPRPVAERDDATTAISVFCAAAGVWAVRVHHVRGSADAVRVAARWRTGVAQAPRAAAGGKVGS